VLTWFGIALVVGELGQTAAVTYYVAHDRGQAGDYLATSRSMMVVSGTLTLGAGVLGAPLLASGSTALLSGYQLMFVTCLVSFVGASYTFSLQATDIQRWNLVRVSQPVMFLAAIGAVQVIGRLDLMSVLIVLSGTILGQAALAYEACRRERLTGGRIRLTLARPLARYGLGQAASTLPGVVVARFDLIILSRVVAPAELGQYAVAVSLTALAVPLVSAIGSVAFPRLASCGTARVDNRRLQRWAVLGSAVIGASVMAPLAGSATWIVPAVFGGAYRDAVPLVILLAPGGVFLACGQVCGDLLRGHGRPMTVARVQALAAVLMLILLTILVPRYGVSGAAAATNTAAGMAMVLLMRALKGCPPDRPINMATGIGPQGQPRRRAFCR
jgi:O-antigen/teichoic acid export membrane protein